MKDKLLTLVVILSLAVPVAKGVKASSVQPREASVAQSQASELAEADRLLLQIRDLFNQGQLSAALPLAKQVLVLRQKSLPADHILIADALTILGDLYLARTRNKDARLYYQEAIAIYDKQPAIEKSSIKALLERYVCLLVDRDEYHVVRKRLFKLTNGFDYDESGFKTTKLLMPEFPSTLVGERSGSTVVRITVDETGAVSQMEQLCGDPILMKSITPSLRKSRFQPALVSGRPVKVVDIVTYKFTSW
jgi:hypothetical protein